MALPSRIGVAFAAAFIVSPSIASAIPLEYGLNASTTLNGVTEQITGSFGFDSESTVTGAPGCCTQHGTQFSLIGPAPYAGIYVHSLDGPRPMRSLATTHSSAWGFFYSSPSLMISRRRMIPLSPYVG